jgi:hypothetical protein
MGDKSPYTYTLRTQNEFTQHSSCRFQSAFRTALDEETITGLDVPWPTVRDHMEKDFKMRPYRPTFMIELSDADMDWRCLTVCRSKGLFGGEYAIYRSARDRNLMIWSKRIPISRRSWNIAHCM